MEETDRIESDIVNRYWIELVELKTRIYYHIRLRRVDNLKDFWAKALPAVVSSGGILGWIVQNNYGFYWAVLIVLAQIVGAIKHLLPFEVRRNKTFETDYEFSKLYLQLEEKWERIMEGALTKDEIREMLFDAKRTSIDIEHKFLASIVIPQSKSLIRGAREDAKSYFSERYGT